MLTILASMLLLTLTLQGLGSVFEKDKSTDYFLYRFVLGLLICGTLSTLINFFRPIDNYVTILINSLGLFLFCKKRLFYGWEKRWIFLLFILLGSVALLASPENFDTGLYHLPQLLWLRDYPTAIGIVNMHSRLAFNSIWFPIAASFQVPGLLFTPAFCLNYLTYITCCYQLIIFIKQRKMTIVSLIMLGGLIFFQEFVSLYRLSSPSTDVPSGLLGMMAVFYCFLGEGYRKQVFILTLTATLIKYQMAPLLLLNFLGCPFPRKLAWVITLTIALHFTRSILLSGCLIYPMASSCLSSLEWTPKQEKVLRDAEFIKSRGLKPLNRIEDPREWWVIWWQDFFNHYFFKQLLFFVFTLAALYICLRKKLKVEVKKEEIYILAVLTLSLFIWYFNAPYLRMGMSFLILIVVTSGMVIFKDLVLQRSFYYPSLITALLAISIHLDLSQGFMHLGNSFPVIPMQKFETLNGVNRPEKGIKCWNVPLPCTTHLKEDLEARMVNDRWYFKTVN